MPSPLLIIRRVVVEGEISCDLEFKRGLNVIWATESDEGTKSTNRVGKTSVVELIQHGLGRRQKSIAKFYFKPIMDRLKTLWLEIEANGEVLTIERSMRVIQANVHIHEGPYVQGMKTGHAETVSVEELSSVLLRALKIPEVRVKTVDGQLDQLTFPKISRAFILHQEDSFSSILDKEQPEQRRTDVIGFLTGITPLKRFTIEDDLAAVQQKIQELESYFNSVRTFLLRNKVPTLLEAIQRVALAQEALEAARLVQLEMQQQIQQASRPSSTDRKGRLDYLRKEILAVKAEAAAKENELLALQKEEERLKELLSSLQVDRKKSERLQASSSILSSIEFSICPRCLLDITPEMKKREQHARCSLCNRPIRTISDLPPRSAPKTEDINFQIEETQTVIKDVQREIAGNAREVDQLRAKEGELGRRLDQESHAYVSPAVDRLLAQANEISRKETELVEARYLHQQAQALDEIGEELNKLKEEQAKLEEERKEARQPNKTRLEVLRQTYERILKLIDYPGFREVDINSQTLMPYINGNLYIHGGTAFKGLATVSYHLALLGLSRKEDTYFPRMLVVDSPAVGDLNEENHEKLLRYLARLQEHADQSASEEGADWSDWQIILTTRKMIKELEPYIKETLSWPDRMLLR